MCVEDRRQFSNMIWKAVQVLLNFTVPVNVTAPKLDVMYFDVVTPKFKNTLHI